MSRVNKIVQEDKARMNRASPPQPPYPDAGIGALENVANGVPRQTMIANQPHMLAYINPQEEQMLRNAGGAGMPGPDGIPAYWFHSSWGGGGGGSTTTSEPDNDPQPSVWDNIKTTVSNIGTGIKDTFTGGGSDDSGSFGYIGDLVSGGGSDNKGNLGVLGDIGGAIGDAVGVTSYYDDPENDATGTGVATGTDTKTATNTVTYTDSKGGTHSTQAAADAQNILIADEANRVTADANGITIKNTGVFGSPTYVDDSGESYDTPEEAIAANATLVTDNTVSAGTKVETVGALPNVTNSWRETVANLITPFDGASYKNGVLTNSEGQDITGGGVSQGVFGSNYVYGVSDDPTNNPELFRDAYDSDEKFTAALARQDMLEDIPPSDLAYFASFIGDNVLPFVGGYFAGQLMQTGIADRKNIMDAEIAALELGATPLYNDEGEYIGHDTGATDKYNLNYDPTGGNAGTTATGALPTATAEDIAASAAAGQEAAASMKEAGILTVGGKQTPDDPDNVGNTPIFQYNGSDGSYEVVGGLTEGADATLSTNADGTLFIPYDGEDPHTITADTAFIGSTDPNAADYNMSLDLAENGSYVNLDGDTVTGDAFETDFTANGTAILNELGKDILLKTGDDSKMVVGVEGGGYQFVDGTPITNKVLEDAVVKAVDDGILSSDVLDVIGVDGGSDGGSNGGTGGSGGDDDKPSAAVVDSLYNRYRKGGSGAGMPPWLQKYASGVSIDQLLMKVNINGKEYYKTDDTPAKYIEPSELVGAIKGKDEIISTET